MAAGSLGARRLVRSLAVAVTLCLAQPAFAGGDATSSTVSSSATLPAASESDFLGADTLRGRSGKLMARFLPYLARLDIPVLSAMVGDTVVRTPGVYVLRDSSRSSLFTFITLRPFSDKVKGRVGSYRMGYWPFERRKVRSSAYASLDGFIEVTPDNQDTQVSEHFRLRDFLTKDQRDVWPKYLVLDTKLIDKLELVIDDLVGRGYDVEYLSVMSGFRTPQYNVKGVGKGRADASRHQYGDAADVFVDNDRNGRMDDLNRDGRVDTRDARILLQAVDRVEAAYPGLVGGAGVYSATRAHGPFTHIDARGQRARWGRI
ncbi:MAG TPA: hypothetical protein VH638_05095 [Gemmatimonadaceae bacterium]